MTTTPATYSNNGYDLTCATFPHRFPKAHERLFKDLALAYRRSLITITDGKRERTTESDTSRELITALRTLVYSIRNEITGDRLVYSEEEELEMEEARQAEEKAKTQALQEALAEAERIRLEVEAERDRQQINQLWENQEKEEAEQTRQELAINDAELAAMQAKLTEELRLKTIAAAIRLEREQLAATDRAQSERLKTIAQRVEAAVATEAAKDLIVRLQAERDNAIQCVVEERSTRLAAERTIERLEENLLATNQEIKELHDRLTALEQQTATPKKTRGRPKKNSTIDN